MNCWQYLSLEPTTNLRAIKKAYAHQLKLINQETEAEAFIKLREALQEAELTVKYQESFADQQFSPAEQERLFTSDNHLQQPAPPPSVNLTTEIDLKYQHLMLQVEQENFQFRFECCLNTTADCLSHTLDQLSQSLRNQQIDDEVYAQFHLLLIQLDQFNIGEQLAIKDQLLAPLAEIDADVSNPHFHRFLTLWQCCYPEDEQHYNEDYYPQKLQSKLIELRLFQSIGSTSPPFSAKSSILLTDPQDFSMLKMLDMQQHLNTYANQAIFEKFNRFSVHDNAVNRRKLYLGFIVLIMVVIWIFIL